MIRTSKVFRLFSRLFCNLKTWRILLVVFTPRVVLWYSKFVKNRKAENIILVVHCYVCRVRDFSSVSMRERRRKWPKERDALVRISGWQLSANHLSLHLQQYLVTCKVESIMIGVTLKLWISTLDNQVTEFLMSYIWMLIMLIFSGNCQQVCSADHLYQIGPIRPIGLFTGLQICVLVHKI